MHVNYSQVHECNITWSFIVHRLDRLPAAMQKVDSNLVTEVFLYVICRIVMSYCTHTSST